MEEHPDITYANATGYPRGEEPEYYFCQRCNDELLDDEVYEDESYDCICADCLKVLHKKRW